MDVNSQPKTAVDAAYRRCLAIARRSRSNFFWAFSLLRMEQRRGLWALYAFARLVDDWSDDPQGTSGELIDWHAYLEHCRQTPLPELIAAAAATAATASPWQRDSQQIAPALHDMLERFAMPISHLHEIVEGVTLDRQRAIEVQTEEELQRYCYLVASSVGLACLSIWGGYRPDALPPAIACGYAFQLTNILRDVAEDAANHRIYIPAVWRADFGLDSEAWLAGRPTGDWEGLAERLVSLARLQFDVGWQVSQFLQADGRRMFSLMWHTYRQLLEKIARDKAAVWRGRVRLNVAVKLGLYAQHAFRPCFDSLATGPSSDG